ncbi:hypothetical protein BDN70DRAFT_887711, partial [Pholiota conissans]
MYRVFLGAPSLADINADPDSYSWRTMSSSSSRSSEARPLQRTQSMVLPATTIEAASRRISMLYEGMVFDDGPEEDSVAEEDTSEGGGEEQVSVFRGVEQTTLISWPPTAETRASERDDSRDSFAAPSFLLNATTVSALPEKSAIKADPSVLNTQALESQSFGDSYYSDASSIARFPSFHFDMHTLTSLTSLAVRRFKGSMKVNVVLAVLEVEGPDTIRIRNGKDAGKQVSILKMILGDEEGTVVKLTAWREVADEWGGSGKAMAAKRGDIVHIENITATIDPSASTILTASPYLKSHLVICYRTMPYTHEDGRLRPDLRLGISDPSVRKVANIVAWFEGMAGLA